MGILKASIWVGIGMTWVRGIEGERSWLTEKKGERKGRREFSPGLKAEPAQVRAEEGQPTEAREVEAEAEGQDEGTVVRVVSGGQVGWANRRQERVKEALGAETYRMLEGLMYWSWGAEVEEVVAEVGVKRSGFYYRVGQVLERLPQVFEDRRQYNGRAGRKIEGEVAGRIVEMVVGEPGIKAEAVSQRLAEQDGTRVKAEEVVDYLEQARLTEYQGSQYRPTVLPVEKVVEVRPFSRYGAHLLQIPSLEKLGYYEAVPLLDVTNDQTYYSHLLRCQTLNLALSSGKTRLYHTGELVTDEFALALGEKRYPQSSDLHAYFDQIVGQDQAQAEAGVAEAERMIAQFMGQAQQGLARAAQAGSGQAIYIDPHVIALYTAKAIARTKHGTQQRVVKALVKLRVVSAQAGGRPLTFWLGQGDLSFRDEIEGIVAWTSWVTGEKVELVGVDRGALSQEVLEQFAQLNIGLLVWSSNTTTMRQALAEVEPSAFEEAEYETVRRGEKEVQRLKNRVADVAAMTINREGYQCRTIVVEAADSGRRMGIHVVGQPPSRLTGVQILAFMRGKQRVEEEFKQGRVWGSDAFCGGQIKAVLGRERPDQAEVETLLEKGRQLKRRWRANVAEEGTAVAQWQAGERPKRQLNDLLKGIRRRRKLIETDWQQVEELIEWAHTGRVPDSQIRWVVDTRKMALMSQFQDFARLARRETMTLMRRFLKQATVESAIAEAGGTVSLEKHQTIVQVVEEKLDRMSWGQLETRLFAQGGWVHKDCQQKVMYVTLKPFPNPLWQRACELLCEHLNQQQALMRCQDGDYRLHYASRSSPPP